MLYLFCLVLTNWSLLFFTDLNKQDKKIYTQGTICYSFIKSLFHYRIFGGLILDIKRKAPHYLSDYTDAISLQCLASFLFLYCACMSPVITFGGLLGEATEGRVVRSSIFTPWWPWSDLKVLSCPCHNCFLFFFNLFSWYIQFVNNWVVTEQRQHSFRVMFWLIFTLF